MDKEQGSGQGNKGISRRGFMQLVGAGALATTVGNVGKPLPAAAADVAEEGGKVRITLLVNGRRRRIKVEPRWSLLDVLRDKLGLTGSKLGCGRGECGACTVLIDGLPRYACLTLAVEAEGKAITTIEGLQKGDELGPVQKAFWEKDAMQCGYCTPGQIMAAEGLLRVNPDPTLDEIRRGMSGNLCRCGSYAHIFQAVELAARLKRGA
jgi:xanthine dehydrogenase YagT iron-sulfur-binding subunit